MAKKKCYRVQVGAAKLGLISKCMSHKEAKKISRLIDKGGMRVFVLWP